MREPPTVCLLLARVRAVHGSSTGTNEVMVRASADGTPPLCGDVGGRRSFGVAVQIGGRGECAAVAGDATGLPIAKECEVHEICGPHTHTVETRCHKVAARCDRCHEARARSSWNCPESSISRWASYGDAMASDRASVVGFAAVGNSSHLCSWLGDPASGFVSPSLRLGLPGVGIRLPGRCDKSAGSFRSIPESPCGRRPACIDSSRSISGAHRRASRIVSSRRSDGLSRFVSS